MRFIAALLCVVLCTTGTQAQNNCDGQPGSATCVETHVVDSGVAYGTLELPLEFGGSQYFLRAGTLLSAEVAQVLIDGNLIPDSPPFFQQYLVNEYGVLTNVELLTNDLVQFGNAGKQLVTLYEGILSDLQTSFPNRTFTLTFTGELNPPTICQTCGEFLGTSNIEVFGGTLVDTPTPGDTTLIVGQANIERYRVNATISVSAVPEPSAIAQLGAMLLLVSARWRGRYCR